MKMTEYYSMTEYGFIPVKEAIKAVVDCRNMLSPFDLRVDVQALKLTAERTLEVEGFKDVYHMTDHAIASCCSWLRLNQDLIIRRLPFSMSADVINILMKEQIPSKVILRSLQGNSGPVARALLPSKYGIHEDRTVFSTLSKLGAGVMSAVRWVGDNISVIRVVNDDPALLEAISKKFGHTALLGFDLINSDISQFSTSLRGLVYFPDLKAGIILPKGVKSVWKCPNIDGIFEGAYRALNTSANDVAESMKPLLDNQNTKTLGTYLKEIHERKSMDRDDILDFLSSMGKKWAADAFTDIFTDEKEMVTPQAFVECLLRFAATAEKYNRQSALEYIPNIWAQKVQN